MRTLLELLSVFRNEQPTHETVVSSPQPSSLQLLALVSGRSFPFDDDSPLDESCCAVGIVGEENFSC